MKEDLVIMRQFVDSTNDKGEKITETENKIKEVQMEIKFLKKQVRILTKNNEDHER